MLSNRNCFKLLVKMISASPIARCPSFKFLTMQMQPSASWERDCGTVLSVTTMFADKPHRLNGRMRAAILCFDDLASGYRTRGWATRAAGYRAAISCFVQVFGCRHDEAIHALRRPASEKRQGTKSREVGHRRCRGRLWRFSRGTLI